MNIYCSMGLREKVALLITAVIIIGIACTLSLPRSHKRPGFKQYLKNSKKYLHNRGPPTQQRPVFIKPNIEYHHEGNNIEQKTPINNVFNFPDIEYPKVPRTIHTYEPDIDTFGSTKNSSEGGMKYLKNLREGLKIRPKHDQANRKIIFGNSTWEKDPITNTGSFHYTNADNITFPEVQYPQSAAETWKPNFWNYLPYIDQNQFAVDYKSDYVQGTIMPKVVTDVFKSIKKKKTPSELKESLKSLINSFKHNPVNTSVQNYTSSSGSVIHTNAVCQLPFPYQMKQQNICRLNDSVPITKKDIYVSPIINNKMTEISEKLTPQDNGPDNYLTTVATTPASPTPNDSPNIEAIICGTTFSHNPQIMSEVVDISKPCLTDEVSSIAITNTDSSTTFKPLSGTPSSKVETTPKPKSPSTVQTTPMPPIISDHSTTEIEPSHEPLKIANIPYTTYTSSYPLLAIEYTEKAGNTPKPFIPNDNNLSSIKTPIINNNDPATVELTTSGPAFASNTSNSLLVVSSLDSSKNEDTTTKTFVTPSDNPTIERTSPMPLLNSTSPSVAPILVNNILDTKPITASPVGSSTNENLLTTVSTASIPLPVDNLTNVKTTLKTILQSDNPTLVQTTPVPSITNASSTSVLLPITTPTPSKPLVLNLTSPETIIIDSQNTKLISSNLLPVDPSMDIKMISSTSLQNDKPTTVPTTTIPPIFRDPATTALMASTLTSTSYSVLSEPKTTFETFKLPAANNPLNTKEIISDEFPVDDSSNDSDITYITPQPTLFNDHTTAVPITTELTTPGLPILIDPVSDAPSTREPTDFPVTMTTTIGPSLDNDPPATMSIDSEPSFVNNPTTTGTIPTEPSFLDDCPTTITEIPRSFLPNDLLFTTTTPVPSLLYDSLTTVPASFESFFPNNHPNALTTILGPAFQDSQSGSPSNQITTDNLPQGDSTTEVDTTVTTLQPINPYASKTMTSTPLTATTILLNNEPTTLIPPSLVDPLMSIESTLHPNPIMQSDLLVESSTTPMPHIKNYPQNMIEIGETIPGGLIFSNPSTLEQITTTPSRPMTYSNPITKPTLDNIPLPIDSVKELETTSDPFVPSYHTTTQHTNSALVVFHDSPITGSSVTEFPSTVVVTVTSELSLPSDFSTTESPLLKYYFSHNTPKTEITTPEPDLQTLFTIDESTLSPFSSNNLIVTDSNTAESPEGTEPLTTMYTTSKPYMSTTSVIPTTIPGTSFQNYLTTTALPVSTLTTNSDLLTSKIIVTENASSNPLPSIENIKSTTEIIPSTYLLRCSSTPAPTTLRPHLSTNYQTEILNSERTSVSSSFSNTLTSVETTYLTTPQNELSCITATTPGPQLLNNMPTTTPSPESFTTIGHLTTESTTNTTIEPVLSNVLRNTGTITSMPLLGSDCVTTAPVSFLPSEPIDFASTISNTQTFIPSDDISTKIHSSPGLPSLIDHLTSLLSKLSVQRLNDLLATLTTTTGHSSAVETSTEIDTVPGLLRSHLPTTNPITIVSPSSNSPISLKPASVLTTTPNSISDLSTMSVHNIPAFTVANESPRPISSPETPSASIAKRTRSTILVPILSSSQSNNNIVVCPDDFVNTKSSFFNISRSFPKTMTPAQNDFTTVAGNHLESTSTAGFDHPYSYDSTTAPAITTIIASSNPTIPAADLFNSIDLAHRPDTVNSASVRLMSSMYTTALPENNLMSKASLNPQAIERSISLSTIGVRSTPNSLLITGPTIVPYDTFTTAEGSSINPLTRNTPTIISNSFRNCIDNIPDTYSTTPMPTERAEDINNIKHDFSLLLANCIESAIEECFGDIYDDSSDSEELFEDNCTCEDVTDISFSPTISQNSSSNSTAGPITQDQSKLTTNHSMKIDSVTQASTSITTLLPSSSTVADVDGTSFHTTDTLKATTSYPSLSDSTSSSDISETSIPQVQNSSKVDELSTPILSKFKKSILKALDIIVMRLKFD